MIRDKTNSQATNYCCQPKSSTYCMQTCTCVYWLLFVAVCKLLLKFISEKGNVATGEAKQFPTSADILLASHRRLLTYSYVQVRCSELHVLLSVEPLNYFHVLSLRNYNFQGCMHSSCLRSFHYSEFIFVVLGFLNGNNDDITGRLLLI